MLLQQLILIGGPEMPLLLPVGLHVVQKVVPGFADLVEDLHELRSSDAILVGDVGQLRHTLQLLAPELIHFA